MESTEGRKGNIGDVADDNFASLRRIIQETVEHFECIWSLECRQFINKHIGYLR